VTQFWPDGLSIEVGKETGATSRYCQLFGLLAEEVPTSIFWQKNQHKVAEIFSIWRVDINWWRIRSWRTYFLLATDSGLLVALYQDLINGDWYLQRLFD
jgi:hypothetical protein